MMKLIQLLPFLLLCLSCNNNQSGKQKSSFEPGFDTTNKIYAVTTEDTSMNTAIANAKQTIEQFDQALKTNNALYSDFAVKKRYKTPDGGGEHMWIAGIMLVNGAYKGFVNNDAEKTTEVKYGDTVIVRKNEITDWMYLDKNILRGGYTIREMLNQLSKDERIKMEKELGFKVGD